MTDVLVGDVWLCSGQSNMQMTLKECDGGTEAADAAGTLAGLRLCSVGRRASATPESGGDIRWRPASRETARDFSGVGFFFAAELLADAQRRIAPRLEPLDAFAAMGEGAWLVDLRSTDERRREGVIPGSVHIPRSVLEWRLDPDSGYSNPYIPFGQWVIVFCAHGFSSSFAAATLRELGWRTSTDIVGGYMWGALGQTLILGGQRAPIARFPAAVTIR